MHVPITFKIKISIEEKKKTEQFQYLPTQKIFIFIKYLNKILPTRNILNFSKKIIHNTAKEKKNFQIINSFKSLPTKFKQKEKPIRKSLH